MEGGRYFRTGAYEKKIFYRRHAPSMHINIPNKCEKNMV